MTRILILWVLHSLVLLLWRIGVIRILNNQPISTCSYFFLTCPNNPGCFTIWTALLIRSIMCISLYQTYNLLLKVIVSLPKWSPTGPVSDDIIQCTKRSIRAISIFCANLCVQNVYYYEQQWKFTYSYFPFRCPADAWVNEPSKTSCKAPYLSLQTLVCEMSLT